MPELSLPPARSVRCPPSATRRGIPALDKPDTRRRLRRYLRYFEDRGLGLDVEARFEPGIRPARHTPEGVAAVFPKSTVGKMASLMLPLVDGLGRVHQHVLGGDLGSSGDQKHARGQNNHDRFKHVTPLSIMFQGYLFSLCLLNKKQETCQP